MLWYKLLLIIIKKKKCYNCKFVSYWKEHSAYSQIMKNNMSNRQKNGKNNCHIFIIIKKKLFEKNYKEIMQYF